MDPLRSFRLQLEEDLVADERVKRGTPESWTTSTASVERSSRPASR
jgi:hypothetical protein